MLFAFSLCVSRHFSLLLPSACRYLVSPSDSSLLSRFRDSPTFNRDNFSGFESVTVKKQSEGGTKWKRGESNPRPTSFRNSYSIFPLETRFPIKERVQRRDLNPRPSGYEPDELPNCSTLTNLLSEKFYRI